ncbi:hypothetical protein NPIL_691 [Nephila pilipes]|uniref:Uncharacterized protein n=1 Tax=Nephila pilipes TaxID=299642 RepID=A0A8X6I4P4_NEPPI|nr:hypothetical protein NPIL_691 [Nephila pilipes]
MIGEKYSIVISKIHDGQPSSSIVIQRMTFKTELLFCIANETLHVIAISDAVCEIKNSSEEKATGNVAPAFQIMFRYSPFSAPPASSQI